MPTNHAHLEASIFATLLTFIVYGIFWLLEWSLPPILFHLPTPLTLILIFYSLLYPIYWYLWKK